MPVLNILLLLVAARAQHMKMKGHYLFSVVIAAQSILPFALNGD